jgi:hypothetical protein
MPTLTIRRGVAGLVAIGALSVAALAAVPQAEAATLYACVKKNGTARIYSKKPKCKKKETKLSWNTSGPAGKNGLNGLNGANGLNGTNGKNGSNGTNGQDLTSHTPLPSGQSESGAFALGGGTSTGGFAATGISFSQPLAAPIEAGHVIRNAPKATSTHCSGLGKADPGYVCLYEAENSSMNFFDAFGFAGEGKSGYANTYGFSLYYSIAGSGGFVDGSWTVTAP